MASGQSGGEERKPRPFVPGAASESLVSLSQAILAPLDAIAKAQVHAARSFLNFVLQIGYPHRPLGGAADDPQAAEGADETMYAQRFVLEQSVVDDQGVASKRAVAISVPTLALVPVQPLGVDSAHYDVELVISDVERHRQIQASESEALEHEPEHLGPDGKPVPTAYKPRPWYLVADPISVRGTLSDAGGGETGTQKQSSIRVHVEVKSLPMPAGLSKLISAMTQIAGISGADPGDGRPAEAKKP